MPTVGEHLTAKCYVDNAKSDSADESSLLRLDPDEQSKLNEQDSIVLNSTLTSPKNVIDLPNKSYVDSSQESRRNRRDLSPVCKDQDNEFDKIKLTNLYSASFNRDPNSDNDLAIKSISMIQ